MDDTPQGPETGDGPQPERMPPGGPETGGAPPPQPARGDAPSQGVPPAGQGPFDLRPTKLGEMIDRSIKLYQSEFATLAGIVAVIIVPWTLFVYLVEQTDSVAATFLTGGAGFAINPVVAGAVAWAAAELYLGRRRGVAETYRHVGLRLGAVIGASILTTLAILLGFILLIIPGLIAMSRLFAATIAVVIEDKGAGDALRRSWDLVRGSTARVLGYTLVIGLLVGFASGAVLFIVGLFGGGAALLVGEIVASVLFTPLSAVFGVLLYFDLRIRKEGFDLEMMARELSEGV